ncbi:hypothetical protein DFJ74DRAFT_772019 [Hyaloraphidium curvatum]|nr:hypothetical protein DFJ74DRAFT_772019 [Hyaloraphidium curvatum]
MSRVASAVMTVFFSYAAYVQQNDPDGYIFWIPLYLNSALACLMLALNFKMAFKFLGAAALFFGGLKLRETVQWPVSLEEAKKYYDFDTELGRETGGLTIVVLWFVVMIILEDNALDRAEKEAVGRAKRAADAAPANGAANGTAEAPAPAKKKAASTLLEFGLILVSLAILGSVYVMPKYFMKPPAEEHCAGVGFSVPEPKAA